MHWHSQLLKTQVPASTSFALLPALRNDARTMIARWSQNASKRETTFV